MLVWNDEKNVEPCIKDVFRGNVEVIIPPKWGATW